MAGRSRTANHRKVCADDLDALVAWCRDDIGADPAACSHCHPHPAPLSLTLSSLRWPGASDGAATIRAGGIDFGTSAVHAVFLTGTGDGLPVVERVHVALGAGGPDELVALCAEVSHVGIDAPDVQTAGCPLPGVRPARCAEVALAATHHGRPERLLGGPVSMLTPAAGAPFPPGLRST